MARRFVGSVTGHINDLEGKIGIMMKLVRICNQIPDDWSAPYTLGSETVVEIKKIIKEVEA